MFVLIISGLDCFVLVIFATFLRSSARLLHRIKPQPLKGNVIDLRIFLRNNVTPSGLVHIVQCVFYNNATPSGLTRFLKSMTLP